MSAADEPYLPWHGLTLPQHAQLLLPPGSHQIAPDGEPELLSHVVQVRTDVWPVWLTIAEQQRDAARAARDRNPGLPVEVHSEFQEPLSAEHRAAMASVCASAFAMEAFSNSLHQVLPATKLPGRSADARIHQTLYRAFQLSNADAKVVRSVLKKLFRLRDRAVHPPSAFTPPIEHDHFRVGMAETYVLYRVEQAENFSMFARNALWLCLTRPRPLDQGFLSWCEAMRSVLRPD